MTQLAGGVLASWGILLSPAVGALLMSISIIVVAVNAQLLRVVNPTLSGTAISAQVAIKTMPARCKPGIRV